jgi:hypothetical protein
MRAGNFSRAPKEKTALAVFSFGAVLLWLARTFFESKSES